MRITILAAGRIRERWIADGIAEYEKRLGRFVRLETLEIPAERIPADASPGDIRRSVDREGERMLAKWPRDLRAAAMDSRGRLMGSEELARYMANLALQGASHLMFVIGGSHGLSPAVKERCRETISFGPNTFPHQLFRVMLLEQIYRAEKIRSGETYHK